MVTLFSEVLSRNEWLILWDHIFSNPPSFLVVVVVSFLICWKIPLLKIVTKEDLQFFLHHLTPGTQIADVIKIAYSLRKEISKDLLNISEKYTALLSGQYPIFNKLPKFIVDFQHQYILKGKEEFL